MPQVTTSALVLLDFGGPDFRMTDVEKEDVGLEDLELEDDTDDGGSFVATDLFDDQVLRQKIDWLFLSDAFRIRTAQQALLHLPEIIDQLCREAGIDVTVVGVEQGADKGDRILLWRANSGGPYETSSFTLGRRRSRRPRGPGRLGVGSGRAL